MIIRSSEKDAFTKQEPPKLQKWAPGSPGFSEFDINDFPGPKMETKAGEKDRIQSTRIDFLIEFIKCLQQELEELSE